MSVDLTCESEGCDQEGGHLARLPSGRRVWLCLDCAVEASNLPPRRPLDTLTALAAWVLEVLGLALFTLGLYPTVTGVQLDAGLTWLGWLAMAMGIAAVAWSWGVLRDRQGVGT